MANGKSGWTDYRISEGVRRMGRLKQEFIDRLDAFGDRISDVAEDLARQGRSRRVIDQVYGCGTSVGANGYEADEAMSRADFCRAIGICKKEANEARYWLGFVMRRGWIASSRLEPLRIEATELIRVFGAMIANTKENSGE